MKTAQFSFKSRLNSFAFAWKGLCSFFQQEANAWIHLAFTIAVLVLAIYCRVSLHESVALVIVIGFVWVAEVFNTAVEKVMDFISRQQNAEIKVIKDLAAGAVLLSAITALITGAIIFIPKLF
jgi:diacylglycerol kinase